MWDWFSHLSSTNWPTRKTRMSILCKIIQWHTLNKFCGYSEWSIWRMGLKSRAVASVITQLKSFGCYLCSTFLEKCMWTIRTLWNNFKKIFLHFLSAASMCVYKHSLIMWRTLRSRGSLLRILYKIRRVQLQRKSEQWILAPVPCRCERRACQLEEPV
jgi:hypothetical protein